MDQLMDKSTIHVGEINFCNDISVSKQIAPEVKFATIDNINIPLFPTKSGYEYFVFRAAKKVQ